jgi:DNA (cytosine-5)-methyltransferase 1
VFVVASARDDINPAEILFEFEGLRRDIAPSRQARKVTPTISSSGTGVSRVGFNCEDEWFIETSVVGALDTECGGNKMNHQTINSGHLLPVSSFYESSLAQYREANVSGTIKASGGVAGGGSETFLAQPIAYSFDSLASNSMKSSNPHSGCREVDLSKTVDTFDPNPSKNQGGIAIMQPIPIHDQATRHAGKNGEKTMGKGNGLGIGQEGDPMNTLTKGDQHAVAYVVGALACNTGPNGHDAGNFACNQAVDAGHILPVVQPIAFHPTQDPITSTDGTTHGLGCGSSGGQASIAVVSPTLTASNDPSRSPQSTEVTNQVAAVHSASMAVRRLTPIECERLQGFPDNYTNIPWRKAAESPDGPRYKALGNSWAVPVVAWLGQRIKDQLQ